MRWSDVLGGLLVMAAAMIVVAVLALPAFDEQRVFWFWAVALPLAAIGGGFIWYGRYSQIPVLSSRKYPRTACEIPAEIILSANQPAIRCTVIDISEGGAGLSLAVSSTAGIPPSFELVVEGDPARRACRVVWMKPQTLGVEFKA